ncbi:MAG: D-alanyl-D-alanine carboxypeptidase/D-alanyl-D-alanine-endopeptidase [Terriglobia bacterium]
MTGRFLALPLLLLLPLLLPFPSALAAQEKAEAELGRRIEEIIGQGEAEKAFWGIEIYSPARGRTLYARNPHRYFQPASITKLFTTAAALALLGPDYRLRTVVGTRGRIDRTGRLLGHLYLVGGGDPDLAGCALPYTPEEEERPCEATAILDRLAEEVAGKGIQTVTGKLVVDQTFFAPEPYAPGWVLGDLVWSYGAPVRALSLADNAVRVRVEPGERPRDPGRLTLQPFTRFYQIENRVLTAPPGGETLLYVRRDPGSRVLEISGSIALNHKGRTIKIAIEEPSEFVGELFRQALERQGVRVRGPTEAYYAPPPPFAGPAVTVLPVVLAEHLSRPLVEDIKLINKTSQNLHAEMLLRHLGRLEPPPASLAERPRSPYEPPGRRADGSAEAGAAVRRAWLANAGVDPEEVELHDGSGLSRGNLVSPHAVIELLKYVETQPGAALFRDSLPIAGVDGTLKDRMKDSAAYARVRAKTGTLDHTNALAGYLQTRTGETLLFAFFVNHHTLENEGAVKLLARLCVLLVQLPRDENRDSKIENR